MNKQQRDGLKARLMPLLSNDYTLIAQHVCNTKKDRDITGDVRDLLSLLDGREDDRCVKCGRSASRTIICDACGYQDRKYASPVTTDTAAVNAACGCVEVIEKMRDHHDELARRLLGAASAEMQRIRSEECNDIITALKAEAPVVEGEQGAPDKRFEVWWKTQIAEDFVRLALIELEKVNGPKLVAGLGPFGAEATAISAARRKLDLALSTYAEAAEYKNKHLPIADDPHPGYDCGGTCVVHRFGTLPATPPADSIKRAAQEIVDIAKRDNMQVPHRDTIVEVMTRHLSAVGPTEKEGE
ncbi:MAG TPA: hypothetical protein VJS64_09435 [Pyrinomonadaceae bacterium]|nr:hypothetical protein [Pyrinomonadaceae bacterium]